jgi:alanine dehydrogenase
VRIGLPAEIKDGERRVALVPGAVSQLIAAGHAVAVQAGAGAGCGFPDHEYAATGATIAGSTAAAFDADLVVKVKEIQAGEWHHLQPGGALFCYLHLPGDPVMANALLDRRITALAFETVEGADRRLVLLEPMSVIAGELAVPIAGYLLMSPQGGRGVILRDSRFVVLGAGAAGLAAATSAVAMGSQVTLLSRDGPRLLAARQKLGPAATVLAATSEQILAAISGADAVIGAVNVPGARTTRLLSRAAVKSMGAGAVLIDICIDGGGVADTSRATKHSAPTYVEEGVIHYAVANMPAAVPRSASLALSAAVLPYVEALAGKGLTRALREDTGFAAGLQLHGGQVTHGGIANAMGKACCDLDVLLHSC